MIFLKTGYIFTEIRQNSETVSYVVVVCRAGFNCSLCTITAVIRTDVLKLMCHQIHGKVCIAPWGEKREETVETAHLQSSR